MEKGSKFRNDIPLLRHTDPPHGIDIDIDINFIG
jgi:hypothetical protein